MQLKKKRKYFLIFAQNIDCWYTLQSPRRDISNVSTHNLCFGAKTRKIGIPLHTPVLLYIKVGYEGLSMYTVYITRTCFRIAGHQKPIKNLIIKTAH